MHRHPYFDLLLHDDAELEPLAGAAIIQRLTLHEWPLSCVQKLTLADGRGLVYKAAFGPSVEGAFYAQARSPLLASARLVYRQDGYECQLIDWITAPHLAELALPEADFIRLGEQVLSAIAHIQGKLESNLPGKLPGHLPCYLDLRPPQAWQNAMQATLAELDPLHQAGKLHQVTSQTVQLLRYWAQEPGVLAALQENPGLVHTDLSGENIFVTANGVRVIDWQRPIYGPPALDWVALLESAGVDPSRYVPASVMRLQRLLSIHWLAQCASRWFPAGLETHDRQIARLVVLLEQGK